MADDDSFLETELGSTSDSSSKRKQDANQTYPLLINRTKRQKIDVFESVELSKKEDICTHPGIIKGMCIKCGEKMDNQTDTASGYIHKDLRLAKDEITRVHDRDLKNLLSHKKLCLVLDLDHTLLNSTRIKQVTKEERQLMNQSDHTQDAVTDSLFKVNSMHMVTKLRPFVHTFLKEASQLFEMYIYTMGKRGYALQMANLLDPKKVYFDSRVIARRDSTKWYQKNLDVVPVQENAVIILDDTESVWVKDKANLILMERYHFFASSCYKDFAYKGKSFSAMKSDESEVDGTLARILQVLKKIHNMFFDPELRDNFTDRDVRQVLGRVRGEILKGCKIVLSGVFDTKFDHMAEQLGATCVTGVDPSVTHVISTDIGTDMSCWAAEENKFLVDIRWLEATNYTWQRQPEEMFPVKDMKNKRPCLEFFYPGQM